MRTSTRIYFYREHLGQTDFLGFFHMPYSHTARSLSIFCIMKIHRFGPGSNPQPWVQKAGDKLTTTSSRLYEKFISRKVESEGVAQEGARAFDDGPHNFEVLSSDKDDT
ncbi:hypothetical protein TNCV_3322801 [Trichonephila clavipes]|nr:hypothetical protein TNCV_3322801 [Trichonephila clavipes]